MEDRLNDLEKRVAALEEKVKEQQSLNEKMPKFVIESINNEVSKGKVSPLII